MVDEAIVKGTDAKVVALLSRARLWTRAGLLMSALALLLLFAFQAPQLFELADLIWPAIGLPAFDDQNILQIILHSVGFALIIFFWWFAFNWLCVMLWICRWACTRYREFFPDNTEEREVADRALSREAKEHDHELINPAEGIRDCLAGEAVGKLAVVLMAACGVSITVVGVVFAANWGGIVIARSFYDQRDGEIAQTTQEGEAADKQTVEKSEKTESLVLGNLVAIVGCLIFCYGGLPYVTKGWRWAPANASGLVVGAALVAVGLLLSFFGL